MNDHITKPLDPDQPLFLTNPVANRPHRKPPRCNPSVRALLNFHCRRKQHCY